jgi:Succinyl-CoA ligase like flavodoxin domain/CoA binding domain
VVSVDDLPEQVDLAVMAVPPPAVPEVAAQCGRNGIRALVVITSGLGAAGADLLAICRRYGMRLVGPNCYGIIAPWIGLDATFAADHPLPGAAGLVVESGGVGIALLEQMSRLGIGVSSFVSAGDKYDVSATDMLAWWAQDEVTHIAVLYVESFGNPRKFAVTARRVGQRMPVLTVVGGRSPAGQRAAASHTVALRRRWSPRRPSPWSIPIRCRSCRTGRIRWQGTCRPARFPHTRRRGCSGRGTRPARCWPSAPPGVELVSPCELGTVQPTTGGQLPLGFGGDGLACPARVGGDVCPGDMDHGMVWLVAD